MIRLNGWLVLDAYMDVQWIGIDWRRGKKEENKKTTEKN